MLSIRDLLFQTDTALNSFTEGALLLFSFKFTRINFKQAGHATEQKKAALRLSRAA
jgi:hypothetical protein